MRGKRDYERFKRGETLTHKAAIIAQCYVCNGLDEGGNDCEGVSCPLYQFMPYRAGRVKKQISEAVRLRLTEQLRKARKPLKIPVQDAEIL